MKSLIIKRSIIINGCRTSVSVEDSFWLGLKELARADGTRLTNLVGAIEAERGPGSNLSSAIRVYVLRRFKDVAQAVPGRIAATDLATRSAEPGASDKSRIAFRNWNFRHFAPA